MNWSGLAGKFGSGSTAASNSQKSGRNALCQFCQFHRRDALSWRPFLGRQLSICGFNGLGYHGLPDSISVLSATEAVVRAVRQIDVHGIASRISIEVVQRQSRLSQNGPNPAFQDLHSLLLPWREAVVARGLIQPV